MLLCDSLFEYFDLISQFIYLKVLIFFPSPLIQGEPGLARGLLVSGELYSPTGWLILGGHLHLLSLERCLGMGSRQETLWGWGNAASQPAAILSSAAFKKPVFWNWSSLGAPRAFPSWKCTGLNVGQHNGAVPSTTSEPGAHPKICWSLGKVFCWHQ